MAKYCFVNISVNLEEDVEELYILGNTKNLGNWNPKLASKMKKLDAKSFKIRKRFLISDKVEYKIITSKSWDAVEKGIFGEDVENHNFTASKEHYEDIYVHHVNSLF